MRTWVIHYSVATDRGRKFRHTELEANDEPDRNELLPILAHIEGKGTWPGQVQVIEIGEQMAIDIEGEGR